MHTVRRLPFVPQTVTGDLPASGDLSSFCTKLAEAGVPESTMLDMMGHVSTAMLFPYIRAQARRDAIDALESRQLSKAVPKVSPTVSESANEKSAVTH